MSLPDAEAAVDAFFETVAHRCARVDGSAADRIAGLRVLDEAVTHQNPFPRAFSFRKSFYALKEEGEPCALLDSLRARLDEPNEGHVLNLFCEEPEAEAIRYEPLGYQLSWAWDLYARSVEAATEAAAPDGLEIVRVESASLVSAINENDPEYPSSTATLGDERIVEIALLEDRRPVAKGEIVFHDGNFVHVMGMVTIPSHRRRGLGRVVMDTLLARAHARGVRFAVLNASLEASRVDLYPKLGFSSVIRCARLTPAG